MKTTTIRARREAAAALLCALAIALIFATGILHRGKTWGSMEYLNLDFPGGVSVRTDAGGVHGIQNSGPGFTLARGDYRLKLWIDTDGECAVTLSAKNGAAIAPGEIVIGPGQGAQTYDIRVTDNADEIEILVDFRSGTRMDIYEMRLYTPEFADHAFTAAFALIAACALFILHGRGRLTADGAGRLVIVSAAVLVACAPALKDAYTIGHDGYYHMARVMNLADGLRSGQFPVRAGGFSYNGYGAVTSVFYPDLLLYPFAAMLLGGASPAYVMNCIVIAATVIAAASMCACAGRIFRDPTAAVCAAVLYVCAPYRLDDLLVRSALGEAMGMAFLPLFLMGLWEVFLGDERRWPLLALSAFAIFMNHIISTLMCAVLAIGMGALCLPGIAKRPRRLLACVKAAAVTALLSLFFLVPLIDMMGQGLSADAINRFKLENTAIAPAQLLLQGGGDLAVSPVDAAIAEHPAELGLPIVLGCALMLHAIVTAKDRRENRLRAGALLLTMGGVFALMCTTLFPWSYVSAVTGLFDRMQFAWRFLAPASMLLALAAAWGYRSIAPQNPAQLTAPLAAFALVVILPITGAQTRFNDILPFGESPEATLTYEEYTLPGTTAFNPGDHAFAADEGVSIAGYSKDGTRITAHAVSEVGGTVSFPLFAYDGYRAALGGEDIAVYPGENNRVTLDIPAGADGELRIWYESKPLWRACDAVSLATAAGLALLCMLRARKRTA